MADVIGRVQLSREDMVSAAKRAAIVTLRAKGREVDEVEFHRTSEVEFKITTNTNDAKIDLVGVFVTWTE
jgi:hypothetical protein